MIDANEAIRIAGKWSAVIGRDTSVNVERNHVVAVDSGRVCTKGNTISVPVWYRSFVSGRTGTMRLIFNRTTGEIVDRLDRKVNYEGKLFA